MSGIFDALFGSLGERGLKEGGKVKQTIGGDRPPPGPETRRASQTAPNTPRVSKLGQPTETEPLLNRSTPIETEPLLVDTPPPHPTVPTNTVERASEGDTTFSTMADLTAESTQAEIEMCPQPIPFVYHRRTQSQLPDPAAVEDLAARSGRFRRISSPALSEMPAPAPIPSPVLKEDKKPEDKAVPTHDDDYHWFSSWRQEQLDNMKPARLVNEGKMKVLSSFHGPLSLPYARNPSGVDATVPNDSTYHGNTYGLRAVPRHGNDTDRVASGATNSTRSSSGSNMAYLPSRPEKASDSETGHQSLLMIREPYQKIGVTAGAATVDKYGRADHSEGPPGLTRPGLNPSTSPFAQKALARRALGVLPLPSTSETSDAKSHQDPVMALIEHALAKVLSDDSQQWDETTIARLLSTARYFGVDPRKVSSSSSSSSRVPSLETSSSMSSLLSKMPQTPQQLANFHHSKADHSINWRAKNRRGASGENVTPARPTTGSTSGNSPPGPVMTIDELVAKFSPDAKGCTGDKLSTLEPTSPVTTEAPADEPKASSRARSTVKVKTPLGETSTNRSPTTSDKRRSVGSKGTPGAGKLLKKQSVADANPPPLPRSSKAAGKLVAIAEQSGDASTQAK